MCKAVKMTDAQAHAWAVLSRCPGCQAGEEPMPDSEHADMWREVATMRPRKKKARKKS